jgi:hypothetical protein
MHALLGHALVVAPSASSTAMFRMPPAFDVIRA